MPIKEKSSFKKQEYEYESPDGDKWSIFYIESEGRKYVQIGKTDQPDQYSTWDVAMLLDVADQIREASSKITKVTSGGKPRRLMKPSIVDFRNSAAGTSIDAAVQESMRNFDDEVAPIESFSPTDWSEARTGVNPFNQREVAETPEDYKRLKQSPEWIERKTDSTARPNVIYGDSGTGFRRSGFRKMLASELL